MNTKYILIGIGVLVVGGIAAAYSGILPGGSSLAPHDSFTATLVEIQERSGSYECTIKNEQFAQAQIDGMLYSDDGKVRADYDFILSGQGTFEGHIIIGDEYLYAWPQILNSGDTANEGMRFPFAQYQAAADNPEHPLYSQLQITYDFECTRTSVDESRFDPPTDIIFTDQDFNQ